MMASSSESSDFVCPKCKGALDAALGCSTCGAHYPSRGDVVELIAIEPNVERAFIEEDGTTESDLQVQVTRALSAMKRNRTYHREQLEKWLPNTGVVADVGCGTGGVPGFFRNDRRRFLALDLDARMLKAVHTAYPDVQVAIADAFQLPLRNESVDAFVGLGIFELDGTRGQRGAKEAARVLKSGGKLYITVPYRNIWRRRSEAARWRGIEIPAFSKEEITRLLESHGFRVERLRESSLAMGLGRFGRLGSLFPTLLAAESETSVSYRMLGSALRPIANSLLAVATKK